MSMGATKMRDEGRWRHRVGGVEVSWEKGGERVIEREGVGNRTKRVSQLSMVVDCIQRIENLQTALHGGSRGRRHERKPQYVVNTKRFELQEDTGKIAVVSDELEV